jgi:predicted exporter
LNVFIFRKSHSFGGGNTASNGISLISVLISAITALMVGGALATDTTGTTRDTGIVVFIYGIIILAVFIKLWMRAKS